MNMEELKNLSLTPVGSTWAELTIEAEGPVAVQLVRKPRSGPI
jgi:hypothetical protein